MERKILRISLVDPNELSFYSTKQFWGGGGSPHGSIFSMPFDPRPRPVNREEKTSES